MSVEVILFNLDNACHGPVSPEFLSVGEMRRAEKYKQDFHRRRFENGRLWLRFFLAETLDIPAKELNFTEKDGGKPEIMVSGEPLALSWSLSRSEDFGVVVITPTSRVGIDIEKDRLVPEATAIASDFFTEEERLSLRAMPQAQQQRHFLRLWTAKEALTKATGLGLSADLGGFTVNYDDPAHPVLKAGEPPFMPESWHLMALGSEEEWVGTLVSDEPLGEIQLQDRRA